MQNQEKLADCKLTFVLCSQAMLSNMQKGIGYVVDFTNYVDKHAHGTLHC